MPDPIEQYLRSGELPPDDVNLLLRGSPLELSKLTEQAHDFASRFTYQGGSHPGLSVALAADEIDADTQMAARRLSTRPFVGVAPVGQVRHCGFVLLPTFEAPHYTVLALLTTSATLETFLELVSADTRRNPYTRRRGGQ